jgi:hypothetical protein
MDRNFLKALFYAAGAVVLAGGASAEEAVKIGVTQPLTGPSPPTAIMWRRAPSWPRRP